MVAKRLQVAGLAASTLAVALAMPAIASAHVVVTPAQVGVGARSVFSVSVPNEKEVPVTALRIEIPNGIQDAMPTVHTGWTIETKQDSDKNVTEISWTGGSIPAGQRDDFTFKAQAPAKATSVDWKAYQTYADGTVVSWDQAPSAKEGDDDSSNKGPYSVTKVADDTESGSSADNSTTTGNTKTNPLPLVVSLVALVLSVASLTRKTPPQPKAEEK